MFERAAYKRAIENASSHNLTFGDWKSETFGTEKIVVIVEIKSKDLLTAGDAVAALAAKVFMSL